MDFRWNAMPFARQCLVGKGPNREERNFKVSKIRESQCDCTEIRQRFSKTWVAFAAGSKDTTPEENYW
jgi:hypothetical protein